MSQFKSQNSSFSSASNQELLPYEFIESIILSSYEQNWKGLEVIQVKNSLNSTRIPPLPYHVILLHLGTPLPMSAQIGDSEYVGFLNFGSVSIIPAYAASDWYGQKKQCLNILLLCFEPDYVQDVAIASGLSSNQAELSAVFGQSDPQIKYIGLTLKAELESGCQGGQLFAESLATALALHVVKHYSKGQRHQSDRSFDSSLIKVQQVVDYIDEHALDTLSLTELSELSGLSQSYFTRQFKKLTGVAPYQYVLQRRVEQAKLLLQQKKMAIADVALKSGFRDQNHLTRVFRRSTGMTPKTFQQKN